MPPAVVYFMSFFIDHPVGTLRRPACVDMCHIHRPVKRCHLRISLSIGLFHEGLQIAELTEEYGLSYLALILHQLGNRTWFADNHKNLLWLADEFKLRYIIGYTYARTIQLLMWPITRALSNMLTAGAISPAVEKISSPVTGVLPPQWKPKIVCKLYSLQAIGLDQTIGLEKGDSFSRSSRSHSHLSWPSQNLLDDAL